MNQLVPSTCGNYFTSLFFKDQAYEEHIFVIFCEVKSLICLKGLNRFFKYSLIYSIKQKPELVM